MNIRKAEILKGTSKQIVNEGNESYGYQTIRCRCIYRQGF